MRFSAFSLLAAFALSGTAQAQSTPPAENIARFIAISDDALLSSRLIGITVQNASGLEVGKIEDVVFEGGQLVGIVLSVGHILARAEHYVAVDPSSVSINYTK